MIQILFIAVFIAYFCFTIAVVIGNFKYNNTPVEPNTQPQVFVDVIIPFKNESSNLDALFKHLLQQTYPRKFYTVYFVNDSSTDNSEAKVEAFCRQYANCVLVNNSGIGKKEAIITAYKNSHNGLVILCDADTISEKNWILAHAINFKCNNSDMGIGLVQMTSKTKSLWNAMQLLEYKSVEATTIGMAALKMPIMCSAANLSFKRSAVCDIEQALNLNYKSGDDMFLLQTFKRQHKKIDVINYPSAAVLIKPESPSTFINQRMRWSGKGNAFTDKLTIGIGIVVILTNVLMVIIFISMLTSHCFNATFLILCLLKFLGDFWVLTSRLLKRERYNRYVFPLLFILHPFYVLLTTIFGLVKTKFEKV